MSSVAQLSDRLEDLKSKRTELEAARESIVRQMQQFHAQIAVRRKEGSLVRLTLCMNLNFSPLISERDTWKQKYLTEKKKTSQLQEQNQLKPVRIDISSVVIIKFLFIERWRCSSSNRTSQTSSEQLHQSRIY